VTGWIRERRRVRPDGCVLLFVGIGWERKGGAIALEAARRLNEAGIPTTLKIVGSQAPGDLPPYVEQLGFINKNEPEGQSRLAQLYRTSDIFILPSRAEAFGVVVAEAAAFGVPALVSDTGGLAETVSEGRSGFTIPLSDNGTLFAERAKTILADYVNFAESAYAEFEQRLNWTTSVLRLVDLLKQAAGHNA
jgi:glycosyltransferase involved in cell wall biosynthesis